MKRRIIIIFIFLLTKTFLWSQTKKDSVYYFTGMNLSFSSQTNSIPSNVVNFFNAPIITSSNSGDFKRLHFVLSINGGKQYNENWAFGGDVSYRLDRMYQNVNFGTGSFSRNQFLTNTYGAGFFMRYTINPYHKFQFFLQPNVNYYLMDIENTQNGNIANRGKSHLFDWSLRLGALYQFDNHFRLQFSIGSLYYLHGKQNYNSSSGNNYFSQFGFNMNTSTMRIGFEYLF